MIGLGYKGKGMSSSDLTSMKKNRAVARSWSQSVKSKGVASITDIDVFNANYALYRGISGADSGEYSSIAPPFSIEPLIEGITSPEKPLNVSTSVAASTPWSSGACAAYSFIPNATRIYWIRGLD